jgi:hypothetical protein
MGDRKKQRGKKPLENTMVMYPSEKGGIKFEYRDPDKEQLGQQWRITWKNKWMYVIDYTCTENGDGACSIHTPTPDENKPPPMTPSALLDALDWSCLRRLLTYKNKLLEKIAWWAAIAGIGIMALLFIVVMGEIGKR